MPANVRVTNPFAVLVVVSLLASGLAAGSAQEPAVRRSPSVQSPGRRSLLGDPESITGAISLVRPDEGLLIVTKRGPGQPSMLVISGATMVTHNPDGSTTHTDVGVSASQEPGETDYSFRVTGSTVIHVNGRRAALGELVAMRDKKATVHFDPERNGNFARLIDVSL